MEKECGLSAAGIGHGAGVLVGAWRDTGIAIVITALEVDAHKKEQAAYPFIVEVALNPRLIGLEEIAVLAEYCRACQKRLAGRFLEIFPLKLVNVVERGALFANFGNDGPIGICPTSVKNVFNVMAQDFLNYLEREMFPHRGKLLIHISCRVNAGRRGKREVVVVVVVIFNVYFRPP